MLVRDVVKSYSFYSGDRTDIDKLSVTEITGGEPLQIALTRKHSDEISRDKITQATIGSIFDLGFKNMGFEPERIKIDIDGFTVSGEPDIFQDGVLVDNKLTKKYALKMWEKEKEKHQYTLQINFYRMMLENQGKEVKDMQIAWWIKDQSDVKAGDPQALVETKVPHIEDSKLLDIARGVHEEARGILEGKILTQKCNNTFGNDMRCKSYCDVKEFCPYAKKRGYTKVTSGW